MAINISPGPDLIYIISKTIAQGRKIGFASSLEVCAGVWVDILNPKVATFFMAFLSQFVRPEFGHNAA